MVGSLMILLDDGYAQARDDLLISIPVPTSDAEF